MADHKLARYMRPSEGFRIAIDFVQELEEGPPADTLQSTTITAKDKNGLDVTATVLTQPSVEGTKAKVKIVNGVVNPAVSPYILRFHVVSVAGDHLEGTWEIPVKDY
jgi:hypothetical protein